MVDEIPVFAEDELPPPPEHNSIAHDSSTTSGTKASVISYSWSHECTGSNLTLIVGAATGDSEIDQRPVTSVTHNGDALTKIDAEDYDAGDAYASLWYRVAPDTGDSYTIGVTMGGLCSFAVGGATSLTGTAASPIGASNKASGEGDTASVVVATTQANSWVHDVVIGDKVFNDLSVGAEQTERWNEGAIFERNSGGSTEPTTSSGNVTMNWTGAEDDWVIVAAEIKELVEAASAIKSYNGVLWDSIKSINGVAIANIKSINGTTI